MKGLVAGLIALVAVGLAFFYYTARTDPPAEMTEAEIAEYETQLIGEMEAGVEQAIKDRWAWYCGLEERTFEDWAALNDADCWILEPGMDIRGAEVEQFGRDFFGSGGQVVSIDVETLEVSTHGGVAYEIGRYSEEILAPDGLTTNVYKNFFARWKRQPNGDWRLDRWVGGNVEAPPGG